MTNQKVVRYVGDDVWSAANVVEPGYSMKVHYDSKRSPDVKTMVGRIVGVYMNDGLLCLSAKRDSGQKIVAKSDQRLYSKGSHFPDNGKILKIEVFA